MVVYSGKKFGFQPTVEHSDALCQVVQSLAEYSMSQDLKQQNCMVHITLAAFMN